MRVVFFENKFWKGELEMKKIAWVSVLGAVLASGAYAADDGPFIEAAVGSSKFRLDAPAGVDVGSSSVSYSLFGGYMFNKNFGLEGGYLDLGKAGVSSSGAFSGNLYGKPLTVTGTVNADGRPTGLALGARGALPINARFSLTGRAGVYIWTLDANLSASAAGTYDGAAFAANSVVKKSYTGSDGYIGLGANYNVNKQLAVGLGYTYYKLGGDVGVTADNWDFHVNYRF